MKTWMKRDEKSHCLVLASPSRVSTVPEAREVGEDIGPFATHPKEGEKRDSAPQRHPAINLSYGRLRVDPGDRRSECS